MPLDKTSTTINFVQGADSLLDPNQLPVGRFTQLQNTSFVKTDGGGRLNKRNGYGALTSFPDASSTFLTTYKDNLMTVGNGLNAYSSQTNSWLNTGAIQPLQFSALTLLRNPFSPTMVDSTVANGVIGYTFSIYSTSVTNNIFYYGAADAVTGQTLIAPTLVVSTASSQIFGSRIFALNNKFIVVNDAQEQNGAPHATLQYFTIDALNLTVGPTGTISSTYQRSSTSTSHQSFDGATANNALYLSFNSINGLRATTVSSAFAVASSVVISAGTSITDMVSVAVDSGSGSSVFTTWGEYSGPIANVIATTPGLAPLFSKQTVVSTGSLHIVNIASNANNGFNYSYLEMAKTYSYGSQYSTNLITTVSTGIQGSVSSPTIVTRSLGLASKAFTFGSLNCFLSMYSSQNQSTYFLNAMQFNNNSSSAGTLLTRSNEIIAKFAYGNAFSLFNSTTSFDQRVYEYNSATASVYVVGSSASIAYLVNTQITPVNKGTNLGSSSSTNIIYSNQGVNYATFQFGTTRFQTREIASNLHMNGGVMLMYDGHNPVEHNFFLYPDNIVLSAAGNAGVLPIQTYYYQVIYKWSDGQGNIHRSAPSLPVSFVTSSGTSAINVNVPCPRVTYKTTANPISASIYRWSTGLQTYYKIGNDIIFNDTALQGDSVAVPDVKSDAQIIGNEILYTTGGVVEDVSAPPSGSLALFDTRLWLIDTEDPNLLWFSKPCVEGTPVELSDLLTYFVPPSSNEVSSSGPCKCLAAMDDKLIIFKNNSMFYINGTGPDITGANSQYSPPIFITSGVGCSNPASIILTPNGLMFQSAKGIWLLGRDLAVSYVGKEVQAFNTCPVLSAQTIPGTNEARFTLGSSGQTLMYDYFANQWDQVVGMPALSSVIYNGLHTNLQTSGSVTQETANIYLDGGTPTTLGFTTGWINLAGLQGYVRAYRMYLLGKFLSPHTYTVGIAYDYNPSIVQTATINPTNVVGSGSSIEQWQINFDQQQTQAFQLTFIEISSSTAGAGLYLSGMKVVYGTKKDFPRNIGVTNKTS